MLRGGVHQLGEGLSLEARAAHQAAVHVLLRHDVVYVPRLDRAAIQDTDLSGEAFAAELPKRARMRPMASCASSGVAVSPVPMAQMGS